MVAENVFCWLEPLICNTVKELPVPSEAYELRGGLECVLTYDAVLLVNDRS